MKTLLLCAALFTALFLPAQLDAQARRIVLFEHFTNASCGPCASQNPVFDANIASKNNGNYLHIAYHTVWPGRDPMNAYNKDDVAARVTYYSVNGVPDMVMLGNKYRGGPSGVSQEILNRAASEGSPLRIRVKESTTGSTRNVTVDVATVGQIGSAGLRIRVAAVESDISYPTAPGSNGEKDFPNVFRRFINTPAGEEFTPAAIGNINTLNFSYELDAVWNADKIFTVVWIQYESTKEVINAGAAMIPAVELISNSTMFEKGAPQSATNFSLGVVNLGEADVNVRLKFTPKQNSDWNAAFSVNGTPVADEVTIPVTAGATVPLTVDVTPGGSAGLSEYAVSMDIPAEPLLTPQYALLNVISNVTDLLVHNENAWGSGPGGAAKDYEAAYMDGLNQTGSSTIAVSSAGLFQRGWTLGKLSDVKHVYYNCGWGFPAITAELATAFMGLMNAGGNLQVSGQDVGWDTYDQSGHGSAASRSLYRNYLFANYKNDGTATNTLVNMVVTDPLFGAVGTFQLQNVYGNDTQGNPLFYPDQVSPTPEGVQLGWFNADQTAGAGIRGAKNNYKSVYFTFAMEQVVNSAVRNDLMKLTWQWFHGVISSTEFDGAVSGLMLGQNYPNPVADATVVPFEAASRDRVLHVYDMVGRLVSLYDVPATSTQLRIDAQSLRPGMYSYRLIDNGRVVASKAMQIVR